MIKKYTALLAAVSMTAMVFSGCSSRQEDFHESTEEIFTLQSSQENNSEEAMPETPAPDPDAALPPYVYTGEDPVLAGLCEYFTAKNADAEAGGVYIPVPVVLKTEEQGQATAVYGVFWDFWYQQRGGNLFCTRAGANTGVIYMVPEGAALTVDGFDMVRDGGDFTVDLKRICGEDEQLYNSFFGKETREDIREQHRIQLVTQYVNDNELPINTYQDYGWEPVRLMTD